MGLYFFAIIPTRLICLIDVAELSRSWICKDGVIVHKIHRRVFTFYTKLWIWSFHVVVVHRTVKKCIKEYNERTESLFCCKEQQECLKWSGNAFLDKRRTFTVSWINKFKRSPATFTNSVLYFRSHCCRSNIIWDFAVRFCGNWLKLVWVRLYVKYHRFELLVHFQRKQNG